MSVNLQKSVDHLPALQAVLALDPSPTARSAAMGASIKIGKLVDAPLCPKGLILMCGEYGCNTEELNTWAERMRAQVMVIPRSAIQLNWIKKSASRLDFMVVDGDHLGDSGAMIDLCQEIRRALPKLPLVLLSSAVRAHDFTSERMLACDVTLKPPLLHSALTLGVQAAYQNNSHYQRFLESTPK